MLQNKSSTPPTASPTPRDAALAIVQTLHANNHVAYFAGGCVRDALLGIAPKDYDVATSALPDQVASLFHNTQFVGEAFGVTLVRLKKHAIEVATFRKEWGYNDGRHPTQVEFSDAQNDASRRDFTVNGLFENPLATSLDDIIIDYVNGQADLKTKTLRAIGNPDERFAEDYLRMLRAARFAARLGFTLEEKTARAIKVNAQYLGQISRERIGQEIMAMLSPAGDSSPIATPQAIVHAAELIQSLTLDAPSFNEPHQQAQLTTLTHLSQQLTQSKPSDDSNPNCDTSIDYPALLLAWLIDRHRHCHHTDADNQTFTHWLTHWISRDAKAVLSRWRRALILSNAVCDAMTGSLSLIPVAQSWSDMSVAKRKRLLAQAHWPRTHALLTALAYEPCIQVLVEVINTDTPALKASGVSPCVLISGDDLIQLGQKPGPSFRRLLDYAYDLQLEGEITTRNQALKWLEEYLKA